MPCCEYFVFSEEVVRVRLRQQFVGRTGYGLLNGNHFLTLK